MSLEPVLEAIASLPANWTQQIDQHGSIIETCLVQRCLIDEMASNSALGRLTLPLRQDVASRARGKSTTITLPYHVAKPAMMHSSVGNFRKNDVAL